MNTAMLTFVARQRTHEQGEAAVRVWTRLRENLRWKGIDYAVIKAMLDDRTWVSS
jgi:hypothetical protein